MPIIGANISSEKIKANFLMLFMGSCPLISDEG